MSIKHVEVIYETQGRVFHQDIKTPRSGVKKQGTAEYFLTDSQVCGLTDKTLFQMFDIASQTDHKIHKIYGT